jgi:hypothetical protein
MNSLKQYGEGIILLAFSVFLSSLTVYGALGIDPEASPSNTREVTTAYRQK